MSETKDPIELLNEVHQFPCQFTIKAIGKTENDFPARILETTRKTLGIDFDPPYSTRETAHGRHVSVTIEPTLQSAEETLELYRQLQETDGLVMLL